ncbi:MAG: zinc-binding dehydrogenase [Ilumatobacter sp.]|nr:zinc-binding dehydrogenase [Ilumatobacter sp.]
MRAALLIGRGGPEHLVVRDDVPVPTPAADEVLLRVTACGVNNTDINTRVGWYSRSVTGATTGEGFAEARADDATWGKGGLTFPRIQGADPSGTIVAVGEAANAGLVGRRVMVDPWIRDPARPDDRSLAGYLGSERDGGFAQFCGVPARNVHPVATELTDVELASLPCSWSTANHMLHRVDLRGGQRIAVTGASGGVGSALVQLARLRGATVVAIAGRSKLDAVAALGAHAVVARELDDLQTAAVDAAGGPFDVVADVVGGDGFGGWLDALARGGRYVTSGAIAGPVVSLDLRTLYLNDLELYGATVYEPAVFADLVGHVEAGRIRPVVGATFGLGEIHEAQAAFERKEHVGAIVITIDG